MGINIAIDGYSSTGKSTLAKDLARDLNFRYIDSGAMYRAVTLYALRNGLVEPSGISDELVDHLPEIKLNFQFNPETNSSEMIMNGENVEKEIRQMSIAKWVSPVAAISEVRRFLVKQQKEIAKGKQVVMDGRDIGTVVLPDAELKIFVTASDAVRIGRRFEELKNRGDDVTREEVRANLMQRDLLDSTRDDSPLKMAEGARLLDNSNLTRSEQLELAKSWVEEVRKAG